MNILIVDDDILDCELIKKALSSRSTLFNVVVVHTIDNAIARLESRNFDVVLLDYHIQQDDGTEVLIELRNKASCAIIVMSHAEGGEGQSLECLRLGAQDFLIKRDITSPRLRRAIMNAKTRFDLECQLHDSYQQVKHMSESDCLTGLANRYMFDETLKLMIAGNVRTGQKVALILIDLDHFKNVNDNYGHDVGDALLKKVVERIRGCLRGSELFARLGGDEFAIILNDLDDARGANKVGERIISALDEPFDLSAATIQSGASIGISIHPDNGSSSEELFKRADIAMYRAKSLGRNRVCFFHEDMQKQFSERYQLEVSLRKAIKEQEFVLHYQPLFDTKYFTLTGFEALIRWPGSTGVRCPGDFILVAEESRLIFDIGRWVIDEAMKQLSVWNAVRDKPLTMSINLSAIQLQDPHLPNFIEQRITHYQIRPDLIEFELTETALLVNTEDNLQVITGISNLGCRFALDDFGTGYSSVSHLLSFPIGTVKIDRSLVPNKHSTGKELPLIQGLVAMIQHLKLDIVCEGVETIDQLRLCRELNIHKAQGYYFSRPLSSHDITEKYILESVDVYMQNLELSKKDLPGSIMPSDDIH